MAEVYNEAWIETARDKLYALLNALKSTMSSGYNPTFSYLHERHAVAKLLLNAATIDLDDVSQSDAQWQAASSTDTRYLLSFSIRVHTAYGDEFSDGQKQARLLGSITNKLKANYDLGDNYRLEDIGPISVNQSYGETDTYGGEVIAIISVVIAHTQE
jgi:hypothetical protein